MSSPFAEARSQLSGGGGGGDGGSNPFADARAGLSGGGRTSTTSRRRKKKKKGGGGFFHDLANVAEKAGSTALDVGTLGLSSALGADSGYLPSSAPAARIGGNLLKDIGTTAAGIPEGIKTLGEPAGEWLAGAATGDSRKQARAEKKFKKIGAGILKSYEDYYGHDVLHHVGEHPLQPILDALTAASLGAGGAAKATSLLGKAGVIPEESALAQLGERGTMVTRSPRAVRRGKGAVREDLTATKPLVKGREKLGEAIRKHRPESRIGQKFPSGIPGTPIGSEFRRYGKGLQADATTGAMSHMQAHDLYRAATKRLSSAQRVALHIRALDVAPEDIIASRIWENTPDGELLKDPEILDYVLSPEKTRAAKKLARAEAESRSLSKQGEVLADVPEAVAARQPNIFKSQVSELLGRPAREITGEPYYFPHVEEPPAVRSPLVAAGGGKGPPRKLGSMKKSEGKLAFSGRLALSRDVLGPEFLRRISFHKHGAIHKGLLGAGVKMTRGELEDLHGSAAPRGFEFVRDKASTRIPKGLKGDARDEWLRQNIPNPERIDESVLNQGFTTSKMDEATAVGRRTIEQYARKRLATLERRHLESLDEIAAGRYGPIDMNEVRLRNMARGKAKRMNARISKSLEMRGFGSAELRLDRTVKEERRAAISREIEKALAADPENPTMKRWQARVDEMDQIRHALGEGHDLFEEAKVDHGALDRIVGDRYNEARRKEVYYVVPKGLAKAATGEFTKASTFQRLALAKPLKVWRALVLGTRIGFLTNNVVGNHLMYAVRTGGRGALRDYIRAVIETHGRETALTLLKNQATPPGLRADLMKEFFPEQGMHGTFGYTASPATSTLQAASNKAVGAAQAVTGAIPRVTAKVAEEIPRRALLRNVIRNSPEFRKLHRSLPRQTRSFEETARKLLEGEGGKVFQRRVSREVDQALGNYWDLSAFERNVMRNTLPFYSWYKAILTATFHLAADTPGRAAILGQIGRIGREQSEGEGLGPEDVPSYLQGAIGLGGGRGRTKRVLATQGFNPWATLDQLRRGAFSDVGALGVNPFVMAALDAYARGSEHGNRVSPGGLFAQALGNQIGLNLPPTRLLHPPAGSKLYPERDFWTQLYANAGLPIKEFDPGVARQYAQEGQ